MLHYAATDLEARTVGRRAVVVVVGGNTEGRAAPHIAQHGSPVSLEIRGADLDKNMSPHLVDRIDADDRIERASARLNAAVGPTRGDLGAHRRSEVPPTPVAPHL